MKKISTDIFKPYLMKPGSHRPELETPYVDGEYVVATETHVMLFIRKDLLEDEFPATKSHLDGLNIIPICNCDIPIYSDIIRITLDMFSKEKEYEMAENEIECDECDGEGEVYWEYQDRRGHTYQHKYKCPCCDGSGLYQDEIKRPTGNMLIPSSCYVSLNEILIQASNIKRILDTMDSLAINKARILTLQENGLCLFRLIEGIDIVTISTHPYLVSSMPTSNVVSIEL